jgi:hypothetical protein
MERPDVIQGFKTRTVQSDSGSRPSHRPWVRAICSLALRSRDAGGLKRLLAADERAQALVLLAAGGAAVEVRTQARQSRVGVLSRELQLDVGIELREALVATVSGT